MNWLRALCRVTIICLFLFPAFPTQILNASRQDDGSEEIVAKIVVPNRLTLDDVEPAITYIDGYWKVLTRSDVTDGLFVHLAGLDLSRTWCMNGIASALEDTDSRKKLLQDSAAAHAKIGLPYVFSGNYEGEHWLATFAIYLQTDAGIADSK